MLANPLTLPAPSTAVVEPQSQNKLQDTNKSLDAPNVADRSDAEDDFDSELNALLTEPQQAPTEFESQPEAESPVENLVTGETANTVEVPPESLELLGLSPIENPNQLDLAGRTAATTPVDVKPVAVGSDSPVVPSLDAALQSVPQSTEAAAPIEQASLAQPLATETSLEQTTVSPNAQNLPTPASLDPENESANSQVVENLETVDVDSVVESVPETASDGSNESASDDGTSTSQDFTTDNGQSNTTDAGQDSSKQSLTNLMDEVGPVDKATQDTSQAALNSATANRNSPSATVQSAHRVESPAFADLAARNVAETQLAEHVVQARHQIENGRAELEVKLDPPELGKITIELTETKDSLTAKILVAERSTLESMRENTNSILESLASEGVSLDHLQLEASDREQQESEEDHSESLPQRELHARTPTRTTSASSSRGIDILV